MARQLTDQEQTILQAIQDLQLDSETLVDDADIAKQTGLDLQKVQDYLDRLERNGYTQSSNTRDGYRAMLTGEGRSALDK